MEINEILTAEEMKSIAKEAYGKKIYELFTEMLDQEGHPGKTYADILARVATNYTSMITAQHEKEMRKMIGCEIKNYLDPSLKNGISNETFSKAIHDELDKFMKFVICEKQDEIKEMIFDEIVKICKTDLIIKIINQVFHQLDMNSVILEIVEKIQQKEK